MNNCLLMFLVFIVFPPHTQSGPITTKPNSSCRHCVHCYYYIILPGVICLNASGCSEWEGV